MSGIRVVMMIVMINSGVIRHPLVTVVIMCVSTMVVNIMMMPEERIMVMIGTIPIKTLGHIGSGNKISH